MLEGSEVLTLLAEIFVSFAGFTGIVAVLGQRSDGVWRPIDVLRFRGLLFASLVGLVLAITPFGLHYLGVIETVAWGSGSAILAILIIVMLVSSISEHKKVRATEDPDFVPGVRLFLVLLSVPVVITLVLNAVGVGLRHSFSGYLVGLLYLLITCAAMFALLLRFVRSDT
jgi:hypothetical protein